MKQELTFIHMVNMVWTAWLGGEMIFEIANWGNYGVINIQAAITNGHVIKGCKKNKIPEKQGKVVG